MRRVKCHFSGIINLYTFSLVLFSTVPASSTPINLDGPSCNWNVVLHSVKFDISADAQAGKDGIDLIGDSAHPLMYSQYDNKGTSDESDDELGYRFRINGSSFSNFLFTGIDANQDGVLDLFISVDGANNSSAIKFWHPGTDLNISPRTTSISKTPYSSTLTDANNFSFVEVTTVDSSATADIGGDGKNDYFISYKFLFSKLKQAMFDATSPNIIIDKDSAMRYLALSLTQPNSINGDFGGVDDKNDDMTSTFDELGMYSPVATPFGIEATVTSLDLVEVYEGAKEVTFITAVGLQFGDVDYSIIGGKNQDLFSMDSNSGSLIFTGTAPSYIERGDNDYLVEVQVTDGIKTAAKLITVTVLPPLNPNLSIDNITNKYTEEDMPITIPFKVNYKKTAGDILDISVRSGDQTLVIDSGITITLGKYDTTGKFVTGAIELNPEQNQNGVTLMTVIVTYDTLTTSDTFTLVVAPVNDFQPIITSDGGGDAATLFISESSLVVTTVIATDEDDDNDDDPMTFVTYSIIGGDNQDRFSIDSISGELRFINAPNFDIPADSNADNEYIVIVQAEDSEAGRDSQLITVRVTALTPAIGFEAIIKDNILSITVENEVGVKEYQIYDAITEKRVETIIAHEGNYSLELREEIIDIIIKVVDVNGFTQTFIPANGNTVSVIYTLEKGWNLISFPGYNADTTALKSVTVGDFWAWNGSAYEITATPTACQGIWVYAPKTVQANVTMERSDVGISLQSGWNLVGTNQNVSIPKAALVVYAWFKMYEQILEHDILFRGVGYWIFSL